MKYQVLFSLKNNKKKVFVNVLCCSHDWPFKGYISGVSIKCAVFRILLNSC